MYTAFPKTLGDKGIFYLVAKNSFMTTIYPEYLMVLSPIPKDNRL